MRKRPFPRRDEMRTAVPKIKGLFVNGNVVHELGHALIKSTIDIHNDHTKGNDQKNCAYQSGVRFGFGLEICENHIKLLRDNVTRSWPNHDNNVLGSREDTRDSD